jgi:FkbM family methyltransferase
MTAPFPPFPKEDWGGDSQAELDRRMAAFPLSTESQVWIAGAYAGIQVRHFAHTYGCHIRAFEPQTDAYNRYLVPIDYPKLTLHNVGLGIQDGTFEMVRPETDGCSFLMSDQQGDVGGPRITAQMVDTARFMRSHKIKAVDLFLVNMEGYEFTLLPYLIEKKLIGRFNLFLIQFHTSWASPEAFQSLRDALAETHDLWWEYRGSAWSVWKRKD